MTNISSQDCFIRTLSKLRVSSKEAVASADFSSPDAMYMHIERPVQEKFVSILKKTHSLNHAVLVLLCGSVGDGKSHLLSYCNSEYSEFMGAFKVHNDSTASLYVDKPSSFTLEKLMEGFKDENLEQCTDKLILAINHGILGVFLDSDTKNEYSKLKEYVQKSGLLDAGNTDTVNDEFFYSVNFADYHLYELTPNGVKSDYISGILNKITAHDEQNNPFYRDYCSCCANCESRDVCPVKANYELLSDTKIQKGIVNVLIESFIKNKLVISTRSLLNFIYEIIVNEKHFGRGNINPRKIPLNIDSKEYLESLLPNMLFGRKDNSDILETISDIDPLRIRNEKVDDLFVLYANTNSVFSMFSSHLNPYLGLLHKIENTDFNEPSTQKIKELSLFLFVRLCWLTETLTDCFYYNEDYLEFVSALYLWNTGKGKELKKIYEIVEKGVLSWNGYVESNKEMQLPIANQKSPYHLIQSITIKQTIDNLPPAQEGNLSVFKDVLKLKYKVNNNSAYELDVDYSLYKLLHKVANGYIPSSSDKRVNVKCVDFINSIISGGNKSEELVVRDISQQTKIEYKLSYDESFGYSFEVN